MRVMFFLCKLPLANINEFNILTVVTIFSVLP